MPAPRLPGPKGFGRLLPSLLARLRAINDWLAGPAGGYARPPVNAGRVVATGIDPILGTRIPVSRLLTQYGPDFTRSDFRGPWAPGAGPIMTGTVYGDKIKHRFPSALADYLRSMQRLEHREQSPVPRIVDQRHFLQWVEEELTKPPLRADKSAP